MRPPPPCNPRRYPPPRLALASGIQLPPFLPLVLLLVLAMALVMPAQAAPVISEFLASNSSGWTDEDGDRPDWIEIHNPDPTPVPLAGYHLTDTATNLRRWTFPPVTLDPGAGVVQGNKFLVFEGASALAELRATLVPNK